MKHLHYFKLFVFALGISLWINVQAVGAATLIVGDGESYTTIQSAINAANNGDTIIVKDGVYDGNTIEVQKSVTLKSENGKTDTTLNYGFSIRANEVTVDGFNIKTGISIGSYGPGYATDNIISNNTIKNGIGMSYALRNRLENNSTGGIGLNLRCYDNEVIDNIVNGRILVQQISNRNVISGNTVSSATYGIQLQGDSFTPLEGNIVYNNYCNSNDTAISLAFANNNLIIGNLVSFNDSGMNLASDNNYFAANTFSSNSYNAINVRGTMTGNRFQFNNFNNFDQNNGSINLWVSDPASSNIWNSNIEVYYQYNGSFHRGYLGNYYNDHSLFDSNGDGITNTNYDIAGDEPDGQYPLAAIPDNFNLVVWNLETDLRMYPYTGNDGVGHVRLNGGSSRIWIADEAAKTTLNFSSTNPWTGQLAFSTVPAGSSMLLEVGYSTNGSNFIAGGPQVLLGDGTKLIFPFTTNTSAFSVAAGNYLALRVTNGTGIQYDLLAGYWISYISPPDISCSSTTFYQDIDEDGYGNSSVTQAACTHPPGFISDNTDCDDSDALEHPNQTWFKDTDGDDYSDGTTNTAACTRPSGYFASSELIATTGDCDDGVASINPGASEVCNGLDENCNDQKDEGVKNTYYGDGDEDGYGDPNNSTQACTTPIGFVTNNTDCDDTNPLEHPGQTWYKDADADGYSDGGTNTASCTRPGGYYLASELTATSGDCDDGDSDELPNQIWYQDIDGDGYGNSDISAQSCSKPDGYVINNTDCDENDGEIYPGNGCGIAVPLMLLLDE